MRPADLLHGLAKALMRRVGAASNLAWDETLAAQVCQELWSDWHKEQDRRRAELQALVELPADVLHAHAVAAAGAVAANLDAAAQKRLAQTLEQIVEMLHQSFDSAGSGSAHIPVSEPRELAVLLTAGYKAPTPRVILIQTAGPLKGRTFTFEGAASTIIGREPDCNPPFPKDQAHKTISRHHCLLDINPPDIRVRDLGSMGGTFVNGKLIGRRARDIAPGQASDADCQECSLKNGDELRLCQKDVAVFQVKVTVPITCSNCGILIAAEGDPANADNAHCVACRSQVQRTSKRRCVQCGRDVAGEAGTHRHGEYVCLACRHKLTSGKTTEAPAIHGYTIQKLLGFGGMGAVWLARRDATGEPTALKVMLPSVAADQRAVKRFLQEINITRALRHDNLVRLIEAGYQRGTFFLALEYCDGNSVAELIKKRGASLPVDEAVKITLQALDGLHYAHNFFRAGKCLVHRDLKPDNLFLSGSGSTRIAKIGDYGLAKAFDDTGLAGLTRTGETAGTPRFMPRQQIHRFKNPTPDFDVWAIAASLYYMLTRRFPRAFPKGKDQWIAVLETDAVPIRQRNPDIPEGLAEVIDQALVEKPAIGFKTALAFKQALENC